MAGLRFTVTTGVVAVAVLVLTPEVARAQGAEPPGTVPIVAGYLSFNTGVQRPAQRAFESEDTYVDALPYSQQSFLAEYAVARQILLGVRGGVLLKNRLMLGVAVTRFADHQPGRLTLIDEQPFLHPLLTATEESDSLDRTETAIHLQLGYQLPLPSPMEVAVFGGPSFVTLSQRLVSNFEPSYDYDWWTDTYSVAIDRVYTGSESASAWGYNVGADLGVQVGRYFSVGGVLGYSRADVELADPLHTLAHGSRDEPDPPAHELRSGGFHASAGVRLRFAIR